MLAWLQAKQQQACPPPQILMPEAQLLLLPASAPDELERMKERPHFQRAPAFLNRWCRPRGLVHQAPKLQAAPPDQGVLPTVSSKQIEWE
jgi:hypothetical protein